VVQSPRSCGGTPLKPTPIVVCARTSLAVTTRARSAMRRRRGLTPRRACELDGSQHTSGAKANAHAPPTRRRSRVGLRGTTGDVCVSLQASWRLRWQRSGQRVARWSPSFRRGRATEARVRLVAPLRYIDVAGCTAPRLARSGTLLQTRSAQTRATKQRCSVF
jgi:hypothetical protein